MQDLDGDRISEEPELEEAEQGLGKSGRIGSGDQKLGNPGLATLAFLA